MNKTWLNIFRSYTNEELDAAVTKLKADALNTYSSQTIGEKAYQRNSAESRDKLEAAIQVQNERGGRATQRFGVADFSKVRVT